MGGKHDYQKSFLNARFFERHFIDPKMYEMASVFLLTQKTAFNGNYQSRCSITNQCKKILRIFFENAQMQNISRKYVLGKLEAHDGEWKLRLHFMWEFLFFLQDHDCLADEWKQVSHLRERLCSNPSGKISKAILSVPDSSRCGILAFGKNTRLYYLDSGSSWLQEIMWLFLCKDERLPDDADHIVSFLFETRGICVNSVDELNYAAFCAQRKALESSENELKYLRQLVKFYRFLFMRYNNALFEEDGVFDARLLMRSGFAADLLEGYEIFSYNPLEICPFGDKWILCAYSVKEQYRKNATLTYKVDFSNVDSSLYRGLLKTYMWDHPAPWKSKIAVRLNMQYFLNYISKLKSGAERSIFTNKTEDERFTLQELAAYRQHILSRYSNIKTQGHHIGAAATLLKYVSFQKMNIGISNKV